MLPAILEHVTLHDQRVQPHERHALLHLVIGIRSSGKRSGNVMPSLVRHLLDADAPAQTPHRRKPPP